MTPQLVTAGPLAHLHWAAGPTTVVLLHGIGGGRQVWDGQGSDTGAALAAAGYSVLAVDLPGYGDSAPAEPFTLAAMAARVGALIVAARDGALVAAQPAGPCVLVGHSMGGMVAQELLATAPQPVHGVVIASSSPAFGKGSGDWQQRFLAERLAPLDAGLGMPAMARRLVPGMVAPGTPQALQDAAVAVMERVSEATYRAALAALLHFDRRAALPHIAVPTLVITGEQDGTAPPQVAQRMAALIPGARCELVPNAGHVLNIEAPQAFNRSLLGFLQQHFPH